MNGIAYALNQIQKNLDKPLLALPKRPDFVTEVVQITADVRYDDDGLPVRDIPLQIECSYDKNKELPEVRATEFGVVMGDHGGFRDGQPIDLNLDEKFSAEAAVIKRINDL